MAPDDLDEIIDIEKSSTPSPWSRELFAKELKHDHSFNLVARSQCGEKKKLAGYIVYWAVADEMHILNLAVHPDERRKGIGRTLVLEAMKRARDRGLIHSFLEVRSGNEPAIALYETFQFKKVGERKSYYKDGEDAIIMALELN